MNYGVIGQKLAHSFSDKIHQLIEPEPFHICEVAPEELDGFMQARAFRGICVTIPYKQSVIPYLEGVEGIAQEIGAVNTIVNRNGKLYGYNTDYDGLKALFAHANIPLQGKTVAILGTGGTSKTARCVCRHGGAKRIYTVGREQGEGDITYDELYQTPVDVIVNTTPVGMYPNNYACIVDLSRFSNLSGVIDVVYNPLQTALVQQARSLGIPAESGLYMLVAQAVRGEEIFRDKTYAEELTKRIYQAVLKPKQNVVLLGMPTSGKSTIGRMLAERLGKTFVDTDKQFTFTYGISPAQCIQTHGEDAFRDKEEQVVKEVSKQNGAVIATGGGVVLRRQNVQALQQNGVLIFIDRPLEKLQIQPNRPLTMDRVALAKIYQERKPLYQNSCHHIVDASGTMEQTLDQILNKL